MADSGMTDCGTVEAGSVEGPSCSGGLSCGSGESCCTALFVPGGKFKRSFDGDTFADDRFQATVSGFRLDKYEVTVGRYRAFVKAVVAGFVPAEGSGKHGHLSCGAGLNGGMEPGWLGEWNVQLPKDMAGWDSALKCDGDATWSATAGANDTKPITCANWYQAYAFCIWDGGFLPTEAEWNFAAAGGNEQRIYAWGSAAPAADTALAIYNCYYLPGGPCTLAPVGSSPAGHGRWGHVDLSGNAWEWTLDYLKRPYAELNCVDCAFLEGTSSVPRTARGGGFIGPANELYVNMRAQDLPDAHFGYDGLRCARSP